MVKIGFSGGSVVKNLLANAGETRNTGSGMKDLLEEEMATHSSSFSWKIPRTEEPSRLQSMALQRAEYDWASEDTKASGSVEEEVKPEEL